MQTASEFVDDLEKDIDVEDDLWGDGLELNVPKRTWTAKVEDRDREVRLDERIKTLKEAARLMCPYCRMGDPFLYDETWCHKVVGHARALRPCMAEDMHDRIAELEAERGKEGEVT